MTIQNHSFQLRSEPHSSGLVLRVADPPDEMEPLCRVVETAWTCDPVSLLTSLARREGRAFEGVASYAYYEQDPSELEPGVNLSYFDRDQVVDEDFFRDYVLKYARLVLEQARDQAVSLSWPARLPDEVRRLLE
ncbi:MAG: hypothetical protein AB1758_30730 [Candidatus Eremiobacterota bacterium]